MPSKNNKRQSSRRRYSRLFWEQYSDEELLDLRFCDLGLRIDETPLVKRIDRLYDELDARDLCFRPHYWLGEEWFSPDGIPGLAIPFYLAHPRLMQLERKLMLEVEGGTERWCMRLLRHEAGHAFDTAYRLSRRKKWHQVFGKASEPYPDDYLPKPYSKDFVLHLGLWYAQSHPSEDFAETFAVWVKPRSRWRVEYENWPAMEKLEYVDDLMGEIAGKTAPVRGRMHVDPVAKLTTTLRDHYRRKRDHYAGDSPRFHDSELKRLFTGDHARNGQLKAAAFLRKRSAEIRTVVSRWTGQNPYTIQQLLREMIQRCKELDLRVDDAEGQVRREVLVMVAVQTINYMHSGNYRVAV